VDSVILPADLERYADDVAAAGRLRDRSEVVAAGLRLLRQSDAEVAAFSRWLEDARADSKRCGWLSLDEMTARMDQILRETVDGAS
jgi:putative addiction module CopG family antidote